MRVASCIGAALIDQPSSFGQAATAGKSRQVCMHADQLAVPPQQRLLGKLVCLCPLLQKVRAWQHHAHQTGKAQQYQGQSQERREWPRLLWHVGWLGQPGPPHQSCQRAEALSLQRPIDCASRGQNDDGESQGLHGLATHKWLHMYADEHFMLQVAWIILLVSNSKQKATVSH